MSETIPFDCPHCQKGVAGIFMHFLTFPDDPSEGTTRAVVLSRCPICESPMLIQAEREDYGHDRSWHDIKRVWPEPERWHVSEEMPNGIKRDVDEAVRCLKAQIYTGCAVLCGRALERIVADQTKEKLTIHTGLKKLLDAGIIDKRLKDWADELRQLRNIGAHASDVEISKEDARDVLDFLLAICDYIYVLTKKFQSFKERRAKVDQGKPGPTQE